MLKNSQHWEMVFDTDLDYPIRNFYVLNGDNPGEPVDINGYCILIDESGDRYAWYTPECLWNSFHNYPVKNVNCADKYKNKLLVGKDEPYVYDEEN